MSIVNFTFYAAFDFVCLSTACLRFAVTSPTDETAVSSFLDKAPLSFMELNKTLDNSYCSSDDCRAGHGSNFSLAIPLSPDFPIASITMQLQ